MARNRLSWDAEKVASIEKQADPYTMNQNHANNPVEKYKNWDTETGGEGVDTKTPWKGEGRTETGHPSPERQAVMAARKLEDKAIKCITIAQRMLPGASDSIVEEQATDLMHMPETAILSTLNRQASLAEVLAGKEKEEEEVEEAKEAAKKEVAPEMKPEVEEAKEAGDMLDVIFDNVEKTGAKKLSGLVKQASTGDDTLNGLWDSPPDVSKAFK